MQCLMFSNNRVDKSARALVVWHVKEASNLFSEASLYAFESNYVTFEIRAPHRRKLCNDRQYVGSKGWPKELAVP